MPRQSELDVGSQLGPNSRPQVSFSYGKEVRWGAPDSVRPDHIIGNVASIEVKNYDVNKNASKLIYDVSKQALKRVNHLPEGMQQYVRIDTRGQIISEEIKIKIRNKIEQKTNGVVKKEQIRFITE